MAYLRSFASFVALIALGKDEQERMATLPSVSRPTYATRPLRIVVSSLSLFCCGCCWNATRKVLPCSPHSLVSRVCACVLCRHTALLYVCMRFVSLSFKGCSFSRVCPPTRPQAPTAGGETYRSSSIFYSNAPPSSPVSSQHEKKYAQETLARLGENIPSLSVATLIGGVPVKENHKALADGCNVAVGTPGRVKFLMKEGALKVSASKTLVLDSADWLMAPVFQVCVCVCVCVSCTIVFLCWHCSR